MAEHAGMEVEALLESSFFNKDWLTFPDDARLTEVILRNDHRTLQVDLTSGKVDIDYRFSNGDTILHRAASTGSLEIIRLLADKGLEMDIPHDTCGHTALFCAIKMGSLPVVKELVKHKASIDFVNRTTQYTGLYAAVCHRQADILKFLLREGGCNLEWPGPHGDTALWWAAYLGDLEMVCQLVKMGADVNTTLTPPPVYTDSDSDTVVNKHKGDSILHISANQTEAAYKDIAELILSAGADVNIQNAKGLTALSKAVAKANTPIIHLLLEAKCDVNLSYPLMFAVIKNQLDIVEVLISKGCSVNGHSVFVEPPLIHACRTGYYDIMQYLLASGADPNVVTRGHQYSMLHFAAKSPYIDTAEKTARLLIEYGCNLNHIDDSYKETALYMAACHGNCAVAKLLIKAGCDLHVTNIQGHSALQVAIYLDKRVVAKMLTVATENFKHETWLQNKEYHSSKYGLLNHDWEFTHWFWDQCRNPRSLQHLTRHVIRRSLGVGKLEKKTAKIEENIKSLPLPQKLLQYVAFHDLTQFGSAKRE